MKKILVALLIVFFSTTQAQTLKGKVIDAIDGTPLIGAWIKISGTGAVSDIDGNFEIRGLELGNHLIRVEYVSYSPVEFTVEIFKGENNLPNIVMKTASIETGEVEIVSVKRGGTDAAVLDEVRNSVGVGSGLSARQISRSGDQDAASAARRIPGVTLSDNRFVMVRGLQERYNVVLLNGIMAPSLETDVRSFSFDLVPSHLIEKILVHKAPLANLQGDFAGGCVELDTKNFSDYPIDVIVQTGIGVRQNTTGIEHLGDQKYASDRWGNGAQDRSLSDAIPATLEGLTRAQLATYGPHFSNPFDLESESTPVDLRNSAVVGLTRNFSGLRAGSITSVNYTRSASHYVSTLRNYNTYNTESGVSDTTEAYTDSIYSHAVKTGVLQNFALSGKRFAISFKNMILRNGQREAAFRNGLDLQNDFYKESLQLRYVQRDIISSQLNFNWDLPGSWGKINGGLGYNETKRDEPDTRRIVYQRDSQDPSAQMQAVVTPGAQPFFLGRLFMNLSESSRAAHGTYSLDLIKGKDDNKQPIWNLSAGVYHQFKSRFFSIRNLGYKSSSQFNFDLTNLPITEILDNQNIYHPGGFLPAEDTKPSDQYIASNELTSFFGMSTFRWSKLLFTGGIRYERNIQRLFTGTQTGEDIRSQNLIESVLPSASIVGNVSENFMIRGSYGRTLNRPEFRELAPFAYFDFVQNLVAEGNPELKTPVIDNYDLRAEYYPAPGEVLSIGVFHKTFLNPIELALDPTSTPWGLRPYNAISASTSGLEADIRYSLHHLSSNALISRINWVANACIVKSMVTISLSGSEVSTRPRGMMNQSPYVINTGFYFQHDSLDIGFAVMYNVFGPRLTMSGINGLPDVYEMPRHVVDVQLSLGSGLITKGKIKNFTLKLGVQDSLNQPYSFLQDANENGLMVGNDQLRQQFAKGVYYTAAIAYRLKSE